MPYHSPKIKITLAFMVGYSHRNVSFSVQRNVNLSNVIHGIAVSRIERNLRSRIERNHGDRAGAGQRYLPPVTIPNTYPQIENRPRGLARDLLPIAPVTVTS